MFLRKMRALVPLLALVVLIYALSGCGSNVPGQAGAPSTPTATGNLPDRVRIVSTLPGVTKKPASSVTLSKVGQVQQFYRTMLALPFMPQNIACPAIAGPHYDLTFQLDAHTLTQAAVDRGGCGTVAIAGEKQERLASKTFWDQLEQAIYAATPAAAPQSVAIQHTLPGNQPVETARITDPASAQRLYNAILALPWNAATTCSDTSYPPYQFVFQASDQVIPATLSQQCNNVSLNGNYQSRSGYYTMTAQFKQFLAQTLAATSFAPARPDQLLLTIQTDDTSSNGPVTDTHLMQQIYAKVFTLRAGIVGPDCPSGADKVNHKAKWYTLAFTQWGLPVMNLSLYEGSCKLVQPAPGVEQGQTLLGDAEFWALIQRATRS